MKRTKTTILMACLLTIDLFGAQARAQASVAEAEQLKGKLTPLGAERAGNADGSIPAWTGGMTQVPAGYRSGDPRPDFFAAERRLLSVDARNAAGSAALLSDGTRAMMQRYPDFRVDVYPAHRTAAAPQAVYDATFRNATQARLDASGLQLSGAYGGIPFPIPKTGQELIRNHLLGWRGIANETRVVTLLTASDGRRQVTSGGTAIIGAPYYDPAGSVATFDGLYLDEITRSTEPPLVAGDNVLGKFNNDMAAGDQIWEYLPGQRRTRRAPNLRYDTTVAQYGGEMNIDEHFVFSGSSDRYDWSILGKREMYIPYNTNALGLATQDKAMGPHFFNPDVIRWEKHRVWVLDAVLAAGKRHVVPHRRFYLDEDTWQIVLGEGYDAEGKLWKIYFGLPFVAPDFPGVFCEPNGVVDMRTGAWFVEFLPSEEAPFYKKIPMPPDGTFTTQGLLSYSQR